MRQITNISLDISVPQLLIVHEKQGDSGRWVYASILDRGTSFTIPANTYGVVRIGKPDGTACVYDSDEQSTAVIISGNTVQVKLVDQALTAAGRAVCSVGLYNSSAEKLTAFNFALDIERDAIADATIISTDYYNILTAQIGQVLQAKEDLEEMTVSATTLPAGSAATVSVTGGHGDPFNFAFGIPRGNAGLTTNFVAFTDVPVTASDWAADTTYEGYSYKATIALSSAVTSGMVPFAVLDPENAVSTAICPIIETYDGGVYLWGQANTIEATIKTILVIAAEVGTI